MELRHLRYFLAVGETLNFTKAAARFRVAQAALSRQIRDLEDEIGADLLRRSSRGVKLTSEGKLFLEEVRELLKRTDESVEKVRAVVRGEYSELHVGYLGTTNFRGMTPFWSLLLEMLPRALAAFQKVAPGVKVLLHELSFDDLIAGLRNSTLELAIMLKPTGYQITGTEFESLHTYPYCVVLTAAHPFAQLKSVPLEKVAAEPLIILRSRDYREYLNGIFAPTGVKPRIAVQCDTFGSLLIEVQAGHGVALSIPISNAAASRLLYRPITGATEALSVGIARATTGALTPAAERFCEILRNISNGANGQKPSQGP